MLGPTLIGDQVVQVREPHQQRLLAPMGMMEPLHGEQFLLDGVMCLIEQGARGWHLRVFEDRIPARLLVLEPAPDAVAVGHPYAVRHVALHNKSVLDPLIESSPI